MECYLRRKIGFNGEVEDYTGRNSNKENMPIVRPQIGFKHALGIVLDPITSLIGYHQNVPRRGVLVYPEYNRTGFKPNIKSSTGLKNMCEIGF